MSEDHAPPGLERHVVELVDLLVRRDFNGIAERGWLGRVRAADLARVLDEYGATFIPLPVDSAQGRHVLRLDDGQWAVDQDLWSEEEGHSDLTVELLASEKTDGSFALSIEDLRVM